MAGDGRPELAVPLCAGIRLGLVASRWHGVVTEQMLQRSRAAASDAGLAAPTLARVAGVVELPVVCQAMARGHDAVVALGVVIRGATPHFEYVCDAVTSGLTRVSLDEGVPVGFGVLTCSDERQARERAGLADSAEDKGYEACIAALQAATVLRDLGGQRQGVEV
jgi:6,7-dimethyl-8-ribityllumazine synthase